MAEGGGVMGEAAPGRLVVILFTDIRGYTAYTDARGDQAAAELVRRHDAVVEPPVQAHGGRVVKKIGDSSMVAFESVRAALACSVTLLRALAEHNQASDSDPLQVG